MTHSTEHLTAMAHTAGNRCFGCGDANPIGPQLEFYLAEDRSVVCLATITENFEGHPGYVHGGIIATLLDETMSKAVRAKGLTSMTRHMEVDYRLPVPSGVPIRVEAKVVRGEGRKHWTEGTILDSQGRALARGKGLFIEVNVGA